MNDLLRLISILNFPVPLNLECPKLLLLWWLLFQSQWNASCLYISFAKRSINESHQIVRGRIGGMRKGAMSFQ